MKKLLASALALVLALSLAACFGGNEGETTEPTTSTEPSTTVPDTTLAVAEATTIMPDITTYTVVTDPTFDYMGLFQRLEGWWNIEGSMFVNFGYQEDGLPCLHYGYWDSGGIPIGTLIGGRSTGENTAELVFLFPAITEEGLWSPRPEKTETVLLDLIDYEHSGIISMKLENGWDGEEWHTYTYAGATSEEAYKWYNKWNESMKRETP